MFLGLLDSGGFHVTWEQGCGGSPGVYPTTVILVGIREVVIPTAPSNGVSFWVSFWVS